MNFKKLELNHSPYIGVYASVSNEYGLFPENLTKTQETAIEKTLEIKIIKHNIGETLINGALAKIYKDKVVLSKASTIKSKKFLEKQGFDVLLLNSYLAVGNLIAINKNGLLVSKEFSTKEKEEIESFFGFKAKQFNIGEVSVIGSAIALNDYAMALFPHVSDEDFAKLKDVFKVDGNIATVNYGDGFISNGLLLNNKGVLIGKATTGYEIIRLDDIFGR